MLIMMTATSQRLTHRIMARMTIGLWQRILRVCERREILPSVLVREALETHVIKAETKLGIKE